MALTAEQVAITYPLDGLVFVQWKNENGDGVHESALPAEIFQKIRDSSLARMLEADELEKVLDKVRAVLASWQKPKPKPKAVR